MARRRAPSLETLLEWEEILDDAWDDLQDLLRAERKRKTKRKKKSPAKKKTRSAKKKKSAPRKAARKKASKKAPKRKKKPARKPAARKKTPRKPTKRKKKKPTKRAQRKPRDRLPWLPPAVPIEPSEPEEDLGPPAEAERAPWWRREGLIPMRRGETIEVPGYDLSVRSGESLPGGLFRNFSHMTGKLPASNTYEIFHDAFESHAMKSGIEMEDWFLYRFGFHFRPMFGNVSMEHEKEIHRAATEAGASFIQVVNEVSVLGPDPRTGAKRGSIREGEAILVSWDLPGGVDVDVIKDVISKAIDSIQEIYAILELDYERVFWSMFWDTDEMMY